MPPNIPVTLVVGQVAMAGPNSAVQVVGSNLNRKRILIRTSNAATLNAIAFLGPNNTVTENNGYTVPSTGTGEVTELTTTGEIWAVAALGTFVIFAEESY